jgi:L-2-hydroxyglutarate oxidase LhgO
METLDFDVAVVGAGVVGLAVAESLSKVIPNRSILLIERHRKFGQETSSHNSEVVHAGIYYRGAPLKGAHCVRGKQALYSFCSKHDIPINNCGKFVVATTQEQLPKLDEIARFASDCGVKLDVVSPERVRSDLQNESIVAALWSPTTGIVDSHILMEVLYGLAIDRGVLGLFQNEFHSYEGQVGGASVFVVRQTHAPHEMCRVRAKVLINCAGLASARLANAIEGVNNYKIKPCRGRYFSLSSRWNGKFSSLIYPTPDPAGGLGVHITFDLAGKCRLGPDVDWSFSDLAAPDDFDLYQMNGNDLKAQRDFFVSGRKLIPGLREDDLKPDYVGVRPKLFVDDVLHPDFLVLNNKQDAMVIHLMGIESPGLTAALSLAEDVSVIAGSVLQ